MQSKGILYADGKCELYASTQLKNGVPGKLLTSGTTSPASLNDWKNVKLQFSGQKITGFVDNLQVFTVTDATYKMGLAGLVTGGDNNNQRNTALFDNLVIKAVNGGNPKPIVFVQDAYPMYRSIK